MKIINGTSLSSLDGLIIDTDTRYNLLLDEGDGKAEAHVSLKPGIRFEVVIVDFSSTKKDNHLTVDLLDSSLCEISLACINAGKCDKVYTFDVNHLEGNAYSRTKMAGINAGDGYLKFIGSSFIKNGAHKSDTRQEGKITNLSEHARSEVSPVLLIKDNDVKASHGAALGAYDADVLFYLMSRGLTMEESKKLITYGSLLPIIELLGDEAVVEKTKNILGGLTL